eukprot:5626717-Prymnesium_polylepis.1
MPHAHAHAARAKLITCRLAPTALLFWAPDLHRRAQLPGQQWGSLVRERVDSTNSLPGAALRFSSQNTPTRFTLGPILPQATQSGHRNLLYERHILHGGLWRLLPSIAWRPHHCDRRHGSECGHDRYPNRGRWQQLFCSLGGTKAAECHVSHPGRAVASK